MMDVHESEYEQEQRLWREAIAEREAEGGVQCFICDEPYEPQTGSWEYDLTWFCAECG